jgi:hypothetical protein
VKDLGGISLARAGITPALFLTYYLQQTRGLSPITTGLAFLPMTATIMSSAILALTKLQGRFGPRSLITTGMTLRAIGMLYLTRISVSSSYARDILPALIVIGVGLGLVFSTSISNATLGVEPSEVGVATATVNASQQVGGSLGIALLSTIAASATARYLADTPHVPGLIARAAVHGHAVGFSWAAGIFAASALMSAALFTRRVPGSWLALQLRRLRSMTGARREPQDARGRADDPAANPGSIRGRGARARPRAARGVVDVRCGGRGTGRCGDGRPDRRDRTRSAGGLPRPRHERGAGPARRSWRPRATRDPPSLSATALRSLMRLGVTTLLGQTVVGIDARSVTVRRPEGSPDRIPTRTVIWAAGVVASSLTGVLAQRAGVNVDRAGRVEVLEDLSLPSHPEVLAIGDMIRIRQADGSSIALPGLAPAAMQEGRHAARVVREHLRGRPTRPFGYRDKGNLATIGRASAVAEIKAFRLSGLLAWVTWLTVHLWYLIGFENRLLVLDARHEQAA